MGSIPYTVTKCRHYCGYLEVQAGRSLIWLSPESLWQSLKAQRWMFASNHWTDHRVPSGGIRERTGGAEGFCNTIGRTKITTNQTPQSFQALNHQPKTIHGGTHGSSCICSRGWSYLASMGGEALGSVKARCPSVGNTRVVRWEWVGGEHPHRSREREMG